MSWLMRTGTGRNNVSYGGGSTTKGQYLKRTANGRNNISYVSISSNGTHKLLEKYNTTRNGIRWNNLSFSFFTQYESTYKSSTTITIPSGCTKIDIFCVGGGGGGAYGYNGAYDSDNFGGDGGGGGYTKTVSNISVSSGQSISIIIGTGGKGCYTNNPAGHYSEFDATASSVSRSGTVLCSANGGYKGMAFYGDGNNDRENIGKGGSGGAQGAPGYSRSYAGRDDYMTRNGAAGGSDGSDGGNVPKSLTSSDYIYGYEGQGTTTRAWGSSSGTLYSGGGGGGGAARARGLAGSVVSGSGGAGGSGGGGRGGNATNGQRNLGGNGSANTGGGGGGGGGSENLLSGSSSPNYHYVDGGSGGSGVVLIRFKP